MTDSPSPIAPVAGKRLPWCTLLLSAATATLSVYAAIDISGSWLGRVRIVQLEDYGLRLSHLRDLELWRLVTAQLVHVKQPHMVGDVVCLLLVGTAVERRVGPLRLFLLWLVGGSLAMLTSSLSVPYPWNLGTGASQAVMAIAGAGLWLAHARVDRSTFLRGTVALVVAVAFTIDVVHVFYPKPGHVAGLLMGYLMAWTSYSAPRRIRRRVGEPTSLADQFTGRSQT